MNLKSLIAARLYSEGKTTREIAEILGVSHATVARWIKRYIKGEDEEEDTTSE